MFLYLISLFYEQVTVATCFWIHSDIFCFSIGVFRLLMYKVISNILELIPIIFVTIFYSMPPLFFVLIFAFYSISVFCSFYLTFKLIRTSFSSYYINYTFFKIFFNGHPIAFNIHLQLIQARFQITLYTSG